MAAKQPRRTSPRKKSAPTSNTTASQRRKAARRQTIVDAPRTPVVLHLVSDSTGNLARHMIKAFLTQFPQELFELREWNFVNTPQKLQEALDQVIEAGGIVFHAVVSRESKQAINERCGKRVPCADLTGQFVEFLEHASGVPQLQKVERIHDTTDEYHQRIKALEFTLEHDDGLGLDTIHQADLVLAGVSRTSKTPTSVYLAQQGYRVANVSLAMEVKPPPQLLALPSTKVVGLVIDPSQLAEIRRNRQASWRMGDTSYNDRDHVQQEVTWSRRLFAQRGWRILDVTNRAVEETAFRIVQLMGVAKQP